MSLPQTNLENLLPSTLHLSTHPNQTILPMDLNSLKTSLTFSPSITASTQKYLQQS